MTFRYFVDQSDVAESATLTEAEAHHFLHVMRGKVDDQITLFDGTGVGLQDLAVAAVAVERAVAEGVAVEVDF